METNRIVVRHSVELRKLYERRATEKAAIKQLDMIATRVMSGGRGAKGWSVTMPEALPAPSSHWEGKREMFSYVVTVEIVCEPPTMRPTLDTEWQTIIAIIGSAGNVHDWKLDKVDGEVPTAVDGVISASKDADYVGYAHVEIPDNWRVFFSDIYERDEHIDRIMGCVTTAVDSGWKSRFNGALIGEPACGKSAVLERLESALGKDAIMEFDGPSTTAAGVYKELADREVLPRIIFIEEIEKTSEDALKPLLALGDTRGELRKVTARATIVRDARCLLFCTVNDREAFSKMMSGALASRFAHKVFFPRPDRDLIYRILEREVLAFPNGNLDWIEPTLAYVYDERGHTDPREAIAVCLCGRDALLDGSYQKALRRTSDPRDTKTED